MSYTKHRLIFYNYINPILFHCAMSSTVAKVTQDRVAICLNPFCQNVIKSKTLNASCISFWSTFATCLLAKSTVGEMIWQLEMSLKTKDWIIWRISDFPFMTPVRCWSSCQQSQSKMTNFVFYTHLSAYFVLFSHPADTDWF